MKTFELHHSTCLPDRKPSVTTRWLILIFPFLLGWVSMTAQQDSLDCNTRTALIPDVFDNITQTNSTTGLASWSFPSRVVDNDPDNFATANLLISGSATIRVSDGDDTYPAGNFAGFRISSGLLSGGLLNAITVRIYRNGVLKQTETAGDLVGLSVSFLSDRIDVGFIADSSFNAIEITFSTAIGLGTYEVYHAVSERFCAGPPLDCNLQTAMNSPEFPTIIDYANTGSDGVSIGTVDDPEDAVSADTSDYASLIHLVSVVGDIFLTVDERVTDYPAGTFVGFDIQNFNLVGVGLLNNITLTSYHNDTLKEVVSGANLLLGTPLLSGSGRQVVGFVTTTPVDKIRFTINQPVGVSLGTTRVYSAIFQEFCVVDTLPCNEFTSVTLPDYPLYISATHTGFTGAACVGCQVVSAGNVIDSDTTNFAQIIITSGALSEGHLAVVDALTTYPANTFAGFHIENVNLVDVNLLTGVTVSTYNDGAFVEAADGLTGLVSVGSGLLGNAGEQFVGFVTSAPFDEVRISLDNDIAAVELGTTLIYDVILTGFCAAEIECDTNYFLTSPDFPVFIDFQLTGTSGIACVGCNLFNAENVLTLDTTDFATIEVPVGVAGTVSLAVKDALFEYPPGTIAGFVIEDDNSLLEVELLNTITVSTYLDGDLQEFATGGDLLDLELLILYISAGTGRYNVGFETTLPFDEIRITVGSLAGVLTNTVNVYAAFVDTRNSDGGSLDCPSAPDAIDDFAFTMENIPVNIEVLANDVDSDSPLETPSLVNGPDNGSVMVNADSTITYTPDMGFTGIDSFSYEICDNSMPPLCDTATVYIAVGVAMDSVPCNERTPLVTFDFNVSEDHASFGLSCWEGDFLCFGDDVPANVVDPNTNNRATGYITGVGELHLSVTDNSQTFPGGYFAGFAISSGLLSAGLFDAITIKTYLNDVEQESYSAIDLIGLSSAFLSGVIEVGFVTTMDFDEVEIVIDNLLGVGSYDVHYAVIERYCQGPSLACNLQTPITKPLYPSRIVYEETGSDGILIGYVDNPEALLTADTMDYASLVHLVSVLGDVFITMEETVTDYPAGTYVGFEIQNLNLIGVDLLTYLTLTTYLNGSEQESVTGNSLLVNAPLPGSSGKQTVGFLTTLPLDAIKLTVSQPVGIELGVTRVYHGLYQFPCEGPFMFCNQMDTISSPPYPVVINGANTGISGAACVGCNVYNAGHVIDQDPSSAAAVVLTAGVLSTGSVAVKDAVFTYTDPTFVGFHIENVSLVGADLLTGIIVRTYNDGVLQEVATSADALVSVGSDLLVNVGEQIVGFVASQPFDEVQISLANTVGLDLGTTLIYEVMFSRFCPVDIECDETYFLTLPEFPVFIDFELTGLDGVACVLCEVEDAHEVLTPDNSDFATIQIDLGVAASGSIAVKDGVFDYPAGTLAGFVIEDVNDILQADLFASLTLSTYLDGDFQEAVSGANLIDAELLVLFINEDAGRYNVAIEATLPFDEIRLTVGSLVTAINIIDVYAAFVDTRNSDGPSLDCPDAPIAIDDFVSTPEDNAVIADVLANDIDSDSPLGTPVIVNSPDNGSTVVNADSTITYTPDMGFNGIDSFSYEICDNSIPPQCDTATVYVSVGLAMDTIPCNERVPLVQLTFNVSEEHETFGLACWEGDFLCFGDDVPANVVDPNTNNRATGYITGLGELHLSVTDNNQTFPGGYFAGFAISSGLLQLGVFDAITINTYLNDVQQESYNAIDLIGLSSAILTGVIEVGFVTSMDFDEVEIVIDNLLGVGSYDVHYAVIERYCAGPALACNVQTALNKPTFPAMIDYSETGSAGIAIGYVDDPEDAVSADTSDYASLVNLASVVGNVSIAIKDQVTDYPTGTFVGFDIQNLNILGVGLFDHLTIVSYLDGAVQEVVVGNALLLSAPLLSNTGRHVVGFILSQPADEVKLIVSQPVDIDLGVTRVYSAIFQTFCPGPPLPCNEFVAVSLPDHPLYINTDRTGFTGLGCVGCEVVSPGNLIDAETSNFAQIDIAAGALESGSISVANALEDYPAGTFAGFHIENPQLVGADVLTGITIRTYLDDNLQETATDVDVLVSAGTDILVNTGEQIVGFVTTLPFDEVRISLANTVALDLGTTIIYDVVLNGFCEAEIECDTNYFLVTSSFPVYIDFELTGLNGVACALCEVEDPEEVITPDTADYATIQIPVGVINTGSIAVRDALTVYPPGTIAGFVIRDNNELLQADLFASLTISTYLDGDLQEFAFGANLIDAELLILFINADPGVYNVGFQTSLPFDEIRISVGAVASVLNDIDVFGAFVDTRNSDGGGGGLDCPDGPIAVDDFASTPEETPVVIDVLDNDSDPDGPIGPPVVIDSTNNGTLVVNVDSTITYTPDSNFVGQDTFTYSICDDSFIPLCDTATVIIDVVPVIDTVIYTIPEDSMVTFCANELTTFTEPATDIATCGDPDNGSVSVVDYCITYTPDLNFTGSDTFCVVVCHPDDPNLCDTTIVIVNVTPVNDPPVAVDDNASTDEDVPVIIDVLDNDSDPDSPLNNPTVLDPPNNGMTTVNGDGTVTYTPDPGFNGMDTFTYFFCDNGLPVLCDTATVIVTVDAANDPPVAVDDAESTNEDTPVVVDVLDNDSDPDSPVENPTLLDEPNYGDAMVNPDGTVTYTPDSNFVGMDTFTYFICDAGIPVLCDTAEVIITIMPVTDTIWTMIPEDSMETWCAESIVKFIKVPTSMDTCMAPMHGEMIMVDSCVTYIPEPNYNGMDEMCVYACDPDNGMVCDSTVIMIEVMPVNDPPLAIDDADTTGLDTPVTIEIDTNDTDIDGMLSSPVLLDPPANGMVVINPDNTATYSPDPGFVGTDTFTYVICDDGMPVYCDTAQVAVTVLAGPCISLDLWLNLEGSTTDPNGGSGHLVPMRSTLNDQYLLPGQAYNDPFLGTRYSPPGQPYSGAPWNYPGTEGNSYDSGGDPMNGDANYPGTVTDWVLVSLRAEADGDPVCMAAALLHSDGHVEFTEPFDCCDQPLDGLYFVVVEHRHHMIVMSPDSLPVDPMTSVITWDFRTSDSYINDPGGFGIFVGQKEILPGIWAMLTGNGNQTTSVSSDTDVNFDDRSYWESDNSIFGEYINGDYNMNGDANFNDRTAWERNNGKFTSVPRD